MRRGRPWPDVIRHPRRLLELVWREVYPSVRELEQERQRPTPTRRSKP